MQDRTTAERLSFHDGMETFEADFTGFTFSDAATVDAFYDEIERQLAASGRRWFFLVVYTDCVIAPEAWGRFAERGKSCNISYSLGTVRVGATSQTRDAIREDAGRAFFRANIHDSRDQAMQALGASRNAAPVLWQLSQASRWWAPWSG